MAPSNEDSTGCFAGAAQFFCHLFHKLRDIFHSNNNATVQPGQTTTSNNVLSQEQNSNNRCRSCNAQEGNQTTMANLELSKRSDLVGGSKQEVAEASVKLMAPKTPEPFEFMKLDSEDEDVCPTCLEEYDNENPKIMTKCFHHFHLGCIYEWKERSDRCPVCYQVMVFEETV